MGRRSRLTVFEVFRCLDKTFVFWIVKMSSPFGPANRVLTKPTLPSLYKRFDRGDCDLRCCWFHCSLSWRLSWSNGRKLFKQRIHIRDYNCSTHFGRICRIDAADSETETYVLPARKIAKLHRLDVADVRIFCQLRTRADKNFRPDQTVSDQQNICLVLDWLSLLSGL